MEAARRSLDATGYDEVGLTSLNSGEYPGINRLISKMMDEMEGERTAVSFSSLRASSLTDHLAKQIKRVRKTGFTIAPEAGTDRLRRVINKNIREEDILQACEMAFSNGWSHIKLYFMIGQPTERWEDVEAILEMGRKCLALGRKHQGRRAKITLSASSFIPKPFTPFQWCPMESIEGIQKKQSWLKAGCENAGIRFKWHHPELSRLEGVFSLGDRALGDVVEAAYRRGCSFDGWTERLDLDAWNAAFDDCGIDPEAYLTRPFGPRDPLPWDHLDIGVTRKFLARDLSKALEEQEDEPCGGDNCYGCAPFASSCTGFLHERRSGDVYFGGARESGPVPAAVPGGAVHLPAYRQRNAAPPSPAAATSATPVSSAEPPEIEPSYRYRVQFTKEGSLRFLSHLDVTRVLSRAFRRARIPTAYSRGFHPMPKMAFGPALPVGIASRAEFLDLETTLPLRPDRFLERMNRELPRGIRFLAVTDIATRAASLSKVVNRVIYSARIPASLVSHAVASLNGGGEDRRSAVSHEAALDRLLERPSIPYTRVREHKTKTVDLRPFLRGLSLGTGSELHLDLEMDNGRSAKPHEILEVLYGEGSRAVPVTRQEQLVMRGTKALSPLLAAGRGTGGTRDPR